MVELSLDRTQDQVSLGFAGDTLNTAIYLRRAIACEHEVGFVSMVGCDDFSDRLVKFVERQGVTTAHISRHPDLLPGVYAISINSQGERSFSYWRDNSAARALFQLPGATPCFEQLAGFDVIYASGITLAILPAPIRAAFLDWVGTFRKNGGVFAFDSNFRPILWNSMQAARESTERAWRLCDIALPSHEDEIAIFADDGVESVLDRFRRYGVPIGALKCGASGPLPINAQIDPSVTFPPAAKVVDTTAAGDSFSGAFLANILTGGTLTDAMRAGHACASIVVGHRGAIVDLTS